MWQPMTQRKLQFASDGYAWADPEQQFQQEIKGYVGLPIILLEEAGADLI